MDNSVRRSPALIEMLLERFRYVNHSLRTEEARVHWVRGYVRWLGLRNLRELEPLIAVCRPA